jgi:hypothetical protein
MLLWVLASCDKEPTAADSSPTETGTPSAETGDTGDTTPPPTATGETGETGDTGTPTTPTGGFDPFLSGDPATVTGVVLLSLGIEHTKQWFVSATTFAPGSLHWTGQLDVPYGGIDTCEVRSLDPDPTAIYQDLGALDLTSGAAFVSVSSIATGNYVAAIDVAEVDPRGLTWDVTFEGGTGVGFTLPQAIVFPGGELVVDAPVEDSVVDPAAPMEIRWSGEAAGYVLLDLIPTNRHQWVRCLVADDGSFDIDPSYLTSLQAGTMEVTVARVNAAGADVGSTGTWVQLYAQHSAERIVTVEP